jgi:hypothetical protein
MDRRHFFQNSALVTTGALAGCALPGVAQSRPATPFEFFPGDIIYSGMPENVGPVVRGDVLECTSTVCPT